MAKINDDIFKNIVNELAEKAFWDYCQNTGGNTQEIIDAEKEFDEFVRKLNLKSEIEFDLSYAVTTVSGAYEHQCFLAGYKMAMEIINGGN